MKAAALALLAALLFACGPGPERVTIGVGSVEMKVEVARSQPDQERGLMNRKSLGADEGMIFVYPADRRMSFWMKNTTIPLSIAFISADGEILQIEDMKPLDLTPITSQRSVRYALEANQGEFARAGARVGDRVRLPADFR